MAVDEVGRLHIRSAWAARRGAWIDTGDLARRDEAGDLFLAGRADDMVISGGEKLYPVELERVVARHPEVAAVAVVAIPDAAFGQRLKAVVVRLGDSMLDEAALLLTDNLATGWAGAKRADIPPGGTVVVLGLGAVGQCAVRAAFQLGAGTVLAVDPVAGRRELAAASGATPLEGPTVAAVMEATDGRGAHSVIDAVALDATLADAMWSVRAGGTVSVIGVPAGIVMLPMAPARRVKVTLPTARPARNR